MGDPYRDAPNREPAEAPRDRGIVGDVIAQFADPYAFYRELVQNSIDAGSEQIVVELAYDAAARRMRAVVRDRGEGMTREIVENQLLVLFRSTKEQDSSKIGKFGIGFKSVLAPDPEVVIVTTVRDGKKLVAHLYRDLSYDLFDGGRATQAGTTVALELAMERDAVAAFCTDSEAALRRWCRHATVPIELAIRDGDAQRTVRIDSPLAIDGALVEARDVSDDGKRTIVAALTAQPEPYFGFFNHGLMLAELDHLSIHDVAIKVLDSRLGHTLSRDDVRRDESFYLATGAARRVVEHDLARAVSARMRELAESGSPAYAELLAAVLRTTLPLPSWHAPLLSPREGRRSISVADLRGSVWGSRRSSPVSDALAEAGIPVLRVDDRDSLESALRRSDVRLLDAEAELTAAAPVDMTGRDAELVAALTAILDDAHRAPLGVVFVELAGVRADLASVALTSNERQVLDRDDAGRNPFGLFGRHWLALSIRHPAVEAARALDNPVVAAAHLARLVLLQHRLLDAKRSRKIVSHTLASLGVPA